MVKKNVIVNKNTTTPSLPTTTYYMKSWGYYNKNKKILIEQVNSNFFLINNNGKIELREVQLFKTDLLSGRGLIVDDVVYLLKKNSLNSALFYNTPSLNKITDFLNKKFKPRPILEIVDELRDSLNKMFDFSSEIDIETAILQIMQSWIKPLLNEFFFYGIDSTKGGGKTTMGEIIFFLMRHGFVGGNISSAAIPRLVDELDLNIFVDEIDQVKNEDISGILRKGQRRGNPYVRCEGRDNRPVVYEVAGCHGFSFRSEIEDAFADRTLRTHTSISSDNRLPILNSYKRELLKPLADELFLWFIENIHVVSCSWEKAVVGKLKPMTSRENIYNLIVQNLSSEAKTLLKGVFGRDAELTYLCLRIDQLLKLNLTENISQIIKKKKEDAFTSENYYLEELREFFLNKWDVIQLRLLKDGEDAGSPYYPKNKLYSSFIKHLKELNVVTIGTKKFNSFLRDLGFVEGVSIRSQRFDNYPISCLIFNDEICKKLNIPFSKIKIIHEKI